MFVGSRNPKFRLSIFGPTQEPYFTGLPKASKLDTLKKLMFGVLAQYYMS